MRSVATFQYWPSNHAVFTPCSSSWSPAWYSLRSRLAWYQSWPGYDGKEKWFLLVSRIKFWLHFQQSVYWMSYRAHSVNWLISGFRRDVDEICTLLEYYAASSGNPLLAFQAKYRSHLQGSRSPRRKAFLLALLDPWIRDRYVVPKRR